ncbi:MAG TPA: LLM class flavin-dependent oxidoreductase [Rhizobiaceae bacterium]|nr:LLM class flavin-dependent oxidoreductase [Rhizobiaceae bacterium]
MKFGLFLGIWENPVAADNHQAILHEVIDYVVKAEKLGFVSAFLTEHHFTGLPQIPCSMMVLANLAARTQVLRLGTAVTILPWHNPLLYAEEVGTLDLLSDGRFDCGIGRGFRYVECQGFGIPGEELRARYEEAVEVLHKAWNAPGRFSHHGRFWNFTDAVIDPKPVQQPHPPLWIAVGSDESARAAGAAGHGLLLDQFSDSRQLGRRIAAYREATEAAGRVYDPMKIGVTRAFHLTASEAETRAALEHHRQVLANNRRLSSDPAATDDGVHRPPMATGDEDDIWLIGTPEQVIERIERLRSQGAEYLLLLDATGDHASLERFAAEIMPRFAPGERQPKSPDTPSMADERA